MKRTVKLAFSVLSVSCMLFSFASCALAVPDDGWAYPSEYEAEGNGADDYNALQTTMNSEMKVRFDKDYCTSNAVMITRTGQTVDFNGHSLKGIATGATNSILYISGNSVTLHNILIDGNFNTNYGTAVRWISSGINGPAQYIRVYDMRINNTKTGLVFGNDLYQEIPDAAQSENTIYGLMFRGVQNCIQMNQGNGHLQIIGGDIDCNRYEWDDVDPGEFSLSASRCIEVKCGNLKLSNCSLNRTQATTGYACEGPMSLSKCNIECASTWFKTTSSFSSSADVGNLTLTDCTGYMGTDNGHYIYTLPDTTGECRLSNCSFVRGDVDLPNAGSYIVDAASAPGYNAWITDCSFTQWRQDYMLRGNAALRVSNTRFLDDPVASRKECESRLANGSLIKSGSGAPEGVVTAPVGSLFLRTDGGATTTLYVKTSGSGNTGWTAK